MALRDEYLPARKIGHLSPLPIIDNSPYEFYKLAPERVMMVSVPVGLAEFSAQDVERVFEPIEALTRSLVERGVDIVIQGGVPLPLLIGQDQLKRVLERIERAGHVPATSTVLCVVESAKGLGLERVAVANKWSEAMNATLAEFFKTAGVEVVGTSARSMSPAEFQKMASVDGIELAYRLGKAALQAHPEADGLYIGGGAWLVMPATLRLEQEFGKPVINNQTSVIWDVCRKLDYWQARPGLSRLMATP
jgi:maleate cis-trans isomerase